MPQPTPPTDSPSTLRDLVGDDATATFENDPNFIDSNPTGNASTENVNTQADVDEDDDLVEDGEDDDDLEDEEEDIDDEEDDLEDDADDELDADEDEDDADEVAASPALRADGLLGDEDEQEDASKGRDRAQGDAVRRREEAGIKDGEDDDDGDISKGVDEDELNDDDLDTDTVAAPPASLMATLAAGRSATLWP